MTENTPTADQVLEQLEDDREAEHRREVARIAAASYGNSDKFPTFQTTDASPAALERQAPA